MLRSLLHHWPVWLPLSIALPALALAFLLLTPPLKPGVYEAIKPGMAVHEVDDLMKLNGFLWLETGESLSDGSKFWLSPDGDLIEVKYSRSDAGVAMRGTVEKNPPLADLIESRIESVWARRDVTGKHLSLGRANGFERLKRRVRATLGF
jgi:hypothetical protein